MNGLEFIKSKQQNWARRKGFELIGGAIPDRGEKNYLHNLSDNLFEPLSKESLDCYNSGDGNETRDGRTHLAKMKALHSSSAIVVNLFQHWNGKDVSPLLYACKLCSKSAKNISTTKIKFEEKFEISNDRAQFPFSPNLDVVIEGSQSLVYAIESKFTEPYGGRKHSGIKQKYIDNASFWTGLPNLYELAKEICPNDNKFRYLDAPQLMKHILGLKKKHNKTGFRLLYLWYDVVGKEGYEHRKEIEQFAEIAKKDNINFSHITYQEVIIKLSKEFYVGNESYCDYITDRYL
ncbi:hypothetical protein D0T49_12690 [Paludibacter sp. 221]|uniref:PGN_0703 family putative restriction endonuclease n=1 Tax=Paludibacter sp. 221 TaxID=2302939 RepID=UPI0013D3937D|nr:hypothetical protein [Paludibacter sp. 221]NDV47904.1 hypothetical protein [Paludibacter sp. 221]